MSVSLGTNSGHIFFKSLCVTLLIHFLFWLLKVLIWKEEKVTKYIAKKQRSPKPRHLSPYFRTSLSFYLLERKFSSSSSREFCLALCLGRVGLKGPEHQEATRADLCQGLRTVPGREPLTAPSPHWRCTNKQQISNEYLFASKLAKVLAQPGTSNRYVRIFHVLLTDK